MDAMREAFLDCVRKGTKKQAQPLLLKVLGSVCVCLLRCLCDARLGADLYRNISSFSKYKAHHDDK